MLFSSRRTVVKRPYGRIPGPVPAALSTLGYPSIQDPCRRQRRRLKRGGGTVPWRAACWPCRGEARAAERRNCPLPRTRCLVCAGPLRPHPSWIPAVQPLPVPGRPPRRPARPPPRSSTSARTHAVGLYCGQPPPRCWRTIMATMPTLSPHLLIYLLDDLLLVF